MHYASFYNQFYNISHYAIAYIVLYCIFPYMIFGKRCERFFDGIVSNYIRMVFLIIVIGYLFVIIKIFELMSITAVFLVFAIGGYFKRHHLKKSLKENIVALQIWVYDYTDGIISPWAVIKTWIQRKIFYIKQYTKNVCNVVNINNGIMFAVIFGYSMYLRIYDAVTHAAPAMSDAYVTLAWMKYISGRILFHDGIYPQGFHINLAALQKYAAIDPLYVLKYTGPVNGVFIALGLYFAVSRVYGRCEPGLITALLYGVLGSHLSGEWERQASTNSQEFALIFIIPAIYYFYRYVKKNNKDDLLTGTAAACITGLVHTVAFAFVGMSMGILIVLSLICNFKEYFGRVFTICVSGVSAVIISIIPVGLGLVLGREFNNSAAEFLTASIAVSNPELNSFDYTALCAMGILLFYALISMFVKKQAKQLSFEIYIVFIGAVTFFIYYFGGVLTQNAVISTRSQELWAVMEAVLIGMAWVVLNDVFEISHKQKIVQSVFCTILTAAAIIYFKPSPVFPYKMEYDSSVEQYIRISTEFKSSQWLIVSQEPGYDLVLGSGTGNHLMMKEFLEWYNPREKYLTRDVNGLKEELKTPDIFIYNEKRVFETSHESMKQIYARRKEEMVKLEKWIRDYMDTHDNMNIFYEDENLRIFHIHQSLSQEEKFKNIWQNGGDTSD